MKSALTTVRRFLTAEEVPRWFGLSIVLIYLVGLGSVAQYGIGQARREGAGALRQGAIYAATALAERLAALPPPHPSDGTALAGHRRLLRQFADDVPTRALRIVDARRKVVVSNDPTEFESTLANNAGEVGNGNLIRIPIDLPPMATSGAGQNGALHAPLFLEVELRDQPHTAASLADRAGLLSIVLVVLGALFVVYRCLREQLRGMSRIADRLESHRDRLEDELDSLRIADTIDGVTTAWNQLIDLTQRSLETVQRSDANEELSRALQQSGGGALAEALDAIPDGIMYLTDEVRFAHVNAPLCRLCGWSLDQTKQMTLPDAHAEGVGADLLKILRGALGADGRFETRNEVIEMAGPDEQESSTYRVQVMPLQREHHCGECVVVVRDISQQTRSERARDEFITQVTHELRTPLTNIRAYTETLSSGMFDDPKMVTECYNVITKETRRLARLVEDILSVSQLEVGTIELDVGDVALDALLSDGVRDVRGLADSKNIDLQLTIPAKTEPIRADRDKLAVVINNLLGNAIKYTNRDGTVTVGCHITSTEATITIKDTGIGIDAADHARVFEKFQRASDPQVQNETGSGIGLFTAREIVRRHRGDIRLISEKGQGSTFVVRLPHQGSRASVPSTVRET